ncbi:MAG: flagellar assembly protein FliW [Sphingomonadaceae bacterium]
MQVTVVLGESEERVEVPEEDLLEFPRGMVGFEEFTRYALFHLELPLFLLQSVDDPEVGFVLVDPLLLKPGYEAQLARDDRDLLELKRGERPELLCVVTLSPEGVPAGANLRAPVALNPARRLGAQLIPQRSCYSVHHPLSVTEDGRIVLAGGEAHEAGQEGRVAGPSAAREVVRC